MAKVQFITCLLSIPTLKHHVTVEATRDCIQSFDVDANSSLIPSTKTTRLIGFSIGFEVPVPLPKIVLPVFNGDPKQWVNFPNLFATIISNHLDLASVKKLSYLKSSLQGELLIMIQACKS
ncbi:hypothetical protein PR048_008013 [Dryococelus australis]|uniref:Uncharacterized protein n=1 Tax=Dryococelus australis TaxID=614101 RepID=A0ABQ9HVW6_9NEOP|nr:hypothetical protein PR048_008013 [Dryococelus australis]